MKTCTKCKLTKDFSAYHKDTSTKDGHYPSCIECNKHKRADKVKKAKYDKNYRKTIGLKKAANQYKIPTKELEHLLAKQNNVCAICKQPETQKHSSGTTMRLAVDHCHTTGKVRGFLCTFCNKALGLFRDNPELLQEASKYLTGKL